MGFLPNAPGNGGLGDQPLQVDQPVDKTIEDTTCEGVTYYGRSYPGALTSDPVWQIYRVKTEGGITIKDYADIDVVAQSKGHFKGKFDKIWDDRASLFTQAEAYVNSNSISFDGISEFVSIGDVNAMKFLDTSSFTLSAHFRTSSAAEQAIISKQEAANGAGYRLTVEAGKIKFHLSDGTGRIEIESSVSGLGDDDFHFVSVTYSGDKTAANCVMVIDGTRDGSFVTNSDTLTSSIDTTAPANIGARNSADLFFDGFIDEPSVHSSAVPLAQLISLRNNGTPLDVADHKSNSTLVGYWRMGDGDTFPTLIDNSNNSNSGTMTNMVAGNIVTTVP